MSRGAYSSRESANGYRHPGGASIHLGMAARVLTTNLLAFYISEMAVQEDDDRPLCSAT
jgi:hypothetical protein